ncbi:DNA-binding protein [Spirosoma radiotolerans]|uniref:Helix-turn-helix domain-containing protein n=1 Tax=Spirosoma radiotolerans TaxID=1379870 RepID=A0A0E3V5B8_9BACT|nr:DNA-binding protein [Spirosoma radiotolerans]AKD54017.1 hypothetical protein SD10_02970 [Spirosoma radiotolerans]
MDNPFASIDRRLGVIESFLLDIRQHLREAPSTLSNDTLYGNFDWLVSVLPIPESTLRQKIAKDEIPGVKKVGKRLVFDKAIVIDWLSKNDRVPTSELDLLSEENFNIRHQRRGGRKAV